VCHYKISDDVSSSVNFSDDMDLFFSLFLFFWLLTLHSD